MGNVCHGETNTNKVKKRQRNASYYIILPWMNITVCYGLISVCIQLIFQFPRIAGYVKESLML